MSDKTFSPTFTAAHCQNKCCYICQQLEISVKAQEEAWRKHAGNTPGLKWYIEDYNTDLFSRSQRPRESFNTFTPESSLRRDAPVGGCARAYLSMWWISAGVYTHVCVCVCVCACEFPSVR